MIGKIAFGKISRRMALSALGSPFLFRFAADAKAERVAVPGPRKVALALQGGGSHGAFTWGVLDRLLDDATIEVVGITGTSASAMNGALVVDGLVGGGPKQARLKLRQYWEAIGAMPGVGSFFSGIGLKRE